MLGILVGYPFLAVLPAVLLLWSGARIRSRIARYAGMAWLVYGLYEYGMKVRLLCTGECNIRVDLLLIYPLLAVVSFIGAAAVVRARRAA